MINGELKLPIGGVYPLAEVAEAHRALEGRQTVGKLLLEVDAGIQTGRYAAPGAAGSVV